MPLAIVSGLLSPLSTSQTRNLCHTFARPYTTTRIRTLLVLAILLELVITSHSQLPHHQLAPLTSAISFSDALLLCLELGHHPPSQGFQPLVVFFEGSHAS